MSTAEQTKSRHTSSRNTQMMVRVAMLSALAFGLSLLSIPLPIFPSFLEIDVADTPAVFAALVMGPLPAIVIQLVKNLLSFLIEGSKTAGVGEFANFIMGATMVIPIGIMFRKEKSAKRFVIGAVISVLLTTVVACIMNYFVLLPAFALAFNTTTDTFVAMGGAIIPFIDTMGEFLLFSIAPFNIFKGIIVFSVSYLIYKFMKNVNI
ncbi:MAG: ECF transporter S component [Lachnospirales bacterium]